MKKRGVKTPKERQNSAIEDDPSRVAGPSVQDKSTVQNIDDYQCCGSLDVDFPEVCALLGMTEVPAVTQRKKTTASQNTEQSTMESSQSNVPNGEETTPWCPKPRLQVELENEEDPRSAREVRVLGWKVDERVTRALNKTLPCLTNLQQLHMWQVGLTGRTLSSLTNTVSLCSSLRTVALEGTPVPEQCFHLLMTEDSKLVHLSLRNNRIGEEGAQLIGAALSTARGANKSLLSLNMAFNSIGDAGAQHIAKGLRLNRTLLCLSLGFNHIGDDGASYLAEVLGPFSLSHEEIVERRKLLSRKDPQALSSDSSHAPSVPSSSSLERTATKGGKPASKKKPPPKKEEKQAANQAAGAAAKKEDQKNAKKGADAKVPRGRGLKSGGRERSLSALDTETSGSQSKIAEATEMVSPLLDTDAQHGQGRILLPGNNVLTSLNLSGNRLTERSLSLFLKAVKEQDDGGLLRLSLSRNRFPLLNCETYQKIQEVMKCKDPLSKNIPAAVREEQGRSAESQNLTDSGELGQNSTHKEGHRQTANKS
ncbi:leucine-rich repeat-containing protein 71 [Conger conger]|uniref:leucine-rich repeat-containing protein 71 n=1 Tax=Conger conger TaxID=82655 RepID=UPI002A59B92B|nr:leucine-rich repeat-containing protein 71 [Conger conger]